MANSEGVVFPIGKSGKRSTMQTGQKIFAAAARAVDPSLADAILAERKWRSNYINYVETLTIQALKSAENAVAIAQHGLNAAHDILKFERDGKTMPLADAMTAPAVSLHTAIIRGSGTATELTVPHNNQALRGAELAAQLQTWLDTDNLEADHKTAIEAVCVHPEWLNSNRAYVLLGAGSEMGPFESLLAMGATVIALDLDRPKIWQRLIATARESAGTLIFPVSAKLNGATDDATLAQHAGANLISQAPEIAAWLTTVEHPLTIGCYAYLDGGARVRVSVAMDAIVTTVAQAKPDTSFAYLLTPTDVYAIPQTAAARSEARAKAGRIYSLMNMVTVRSLFQPNMRRYVDSESARYGLVNSAITQQGPNYILAKRLQRWRAIVARNAGTVVSCNVAPASYTRSVTKNRLFMMAYRGAGTFGLNAFQPTTTKALMTGMLIYDLHHPNSSAQPANTLNHPHELFMRGANHCGTWRMPYQLSSMLYPCVVRGLLP